tara:strand:- start:37 stop:423 length:387 start_codon:yes stop_codon:yes gene_type:complete
MGFKLKSGNKTNFKSMGSVAKMYGKSMAKNMKTGKYSQSFESPAKKELVGNQKNLPEHLKAKIDAAPGKMYDSPAKNVPDMNDPKVKANYEKYKDNPEYRKALDKQAGGKFSYDKETNKGTTRKEIKK